MTDFFAPTRQALADYGNTQMTIAQLRRQKAMDADQRQRNALSDQIRQAQLGKLNRQNALAGRTQSILQQSVSSPVGPYREGLTNPLSQPGATPNALMQAGNYELAETMRQSEQDQARQEINIIGPLAMKLKNMDPMSRAKMYPAVIRQAQQMAGRDLELPFQYSPEIDQHLDAVATVYQSLQQAERQNRPTGVVEFEQMTADLTPEEKQKARRIKLGLDPRAVGSAVQTITKTGNQQEIAQTESIISGAKEEGKLLKQWKLKPEVESSVALAVSRAKNAVEREGTKISNDKAFNVYNTAMSGLVESMGGTATGPGVGWLPTVTSNAQVAEGAVAAMAPVLKQLFRAAGEGIFTDKDQELLMKMVPTRNDYPSARKAKLENIDAIVRAKLGQPLTGGEISGGSQGTVGQEDTEPPMEVNGIKFLGFE